jgi:hypothetical protein
VEEEKGLLEYVKNESHLESEHECDAGQQSGTAQAGGLSSPAFPQSGDHRGQEFVTPESVTESVLVACPPVLALIR